eukprot:gene30258-50481_t
MATAAVSAAPPRPALADGEAGVTKGPASEYSLGHRYAPPAAGGACPAAVPPHPSMAGAFSG